jgi:hypothetical protein
MSRSIQVFAQGRPATVQPRFGKSAVPPQKAKLFGDPGGFAKNRRLLAIYGPLEILWQPNQILRQHTDLDGTILFLP